MTPQAQTADLARVELGSPRSQNPALTPREIEVLKLLAEGNSNKEIAALLGITPKTADCHRSRIYRKLGLHCIADAVRYAMRKGYITEAA